MAQINGTTGNDVLTGTTLDDEINGDAGNDRINGGAGNDVINGGAGIDTLTGDAGNDTLNGGDGNDGFFGGGGNDTINGDAGDDTMYGDGADDRLNGGDGNDKLYGGTGNDTLDGGAGTNIIDGGAGIDTVIINVTSAGLTDAIRQDLSALKSFMDAQLASAGSISALSTQTAGPALSLAALGLTLSNFETAKIMVDGVETPIDQLLNQAPTAAATVSVSTTEDTALTGQIAAADADGDALLYTMATGPTSGTLSLNADTGAYTYTPNANFSGADSFEVIVTDPSGAKATQTVNIGVTGAADTPTVGGSDQTIVLKGSAMLGTKAGETLAATPGTTHILGGAGNDSITAAAAVVTTALNLSAALSDTDGSETLSITVSGIPAGGTLSAGVANGNGSWTLAPADLAGLSLTASSAADITLHVVATASEAAGGASSSVAKDVRISFDRSAAQSLIEGGSGSDIVNGSATGDVIYGASKPNGSTKLPSVNSEKDNDVISGGDGNDTIYGQNGDDTLNGDAGNDTLSGGKGNDVLNGGAGNDSLSGNSGNDTLADGDGNDTVLGESGSDYLIAGAGDDIYNGGTGTDTLDFSAAMAALNVDISKKTAAGAGNDTFSSIEKFIGSVFNDSFKGSSAADTINAGAGNDWLRGLGGTDQLTGGAGSDTFFWEKTDVGGSLGVDRIKDFSSEDVLDFRKLVGAGSKPVEDFVKITDNGQGTTIAAKINGAFVNVAVLEGVHNTSVTELIKDGQLLVG